MNSLKHPAVHSDQLSRMRQAVENTLKVYPEAERREAARKLGIEHYLPEVQDELALPKPSPEPWG